MAARVSSELRSPRPRTRGTAPAANTASIYEDASRIFEDASRIYKDADRIFEDAGGIYEDAGRIFEDADGIFQDAGRIYEDASGIKPVSGRKTVNLTDISLDAGSSPLPQPQHAILSRQAIPSFPGGIQELLESSNRERGRQDASKSRK